jgi:hypothetical protein
VAEAKFPVFPVEPGISSSSPEQPPLGRENGGVNQSLASKFPVQPEPGIRLAEPGIKSAEPISRAHRNEMRLGSN